MGITGSFGVSLVCAPNVLVLAFYDENLPILSWWSSSVIQYWTGVSLDASKDDELEITQCTIIWSIDISDYGTLWEELACHPPTSGIQLTLSSSYSLVIERLKLRHIFGILFEQRFKDFLLSSFVRWKSRCGIDRRKQSINVRFISGQGPSND
jgi:hypothetical protein